MTLPRVSVLLPVRNAVASLPRAVGSLRDQTLWDWECLAVDDGSTDGSGPWLDRAAREDARLRVLHTPPRGIVPALQEGLGLARGAFVARLDADDACLPSRLEAQVAFLETHPAIGLVGCRVGFEGDPVRGAGYAAYVDWLNTVLDENAIYRERFVESPFAHPSVMFRRSLVPEHGGYREGDHPEDYELWLRWLEAGVRMAKLPETLVQWADPPGRLSRTDPRYAPDAFYRLKAVYLARWWRRKLQHASGGGPRELWVWGAGRLTRRRVDLLRAQGVEVSRYLDIDPHKQGCHRDGRRVIDPTALPEPGAVLVLGYVAIRGARAGQRAFLTRRGYREGKDFLFVA